MQSTTELRDAKVYFKMAILWAEPTLIPTCPKLTSLGQARAIIFEIRAALQLQEDL